MSTSSKYNPEHYSIHVNDLHIWSREFYRRWIEDKAKREAAPPPPTEPSTPWQVLWKARQTLLRAQHRLIDDHSVVDHLRIFKSAVSQQLRVLTGARNGSLTIWDVTDGSQIAKLRGHGWHSITALAVSPNPNDTLRHMLAISAATNDPELKVWNLETGEVLHSLDVGKDETVALAIFVDNPKLAKLKPKLYAVSASDKGRFRVWDLKTGEQLLFFDWFARPTTIAVFNDLRPFTGAPTPYVVAGSHDGRLQCWSLKSGRLFQTFKGHTKAINSITIYRSKTTPSLRAITTSIDKTLKMWDLYGVGRELHTFPEHDEIVRGIEIYADGERAISWTFKQLRIWNLSWALELYRLHIASEDIGDIAIYQAEPNERVHLVSSTYDRFSRATATWHLQPQDESKFVEGHQHRVTSVATYANGTRAISTSADKTLKIWDVQMGALLHTLRGHASFVNHVTTYQDPISQTERALSISTDGVLNIWNLQTGDLHKTIATKTESAFGRTLVVLPNGTQVITMGENYKPAIWNLQSGELAHNFASDTESGPATALFYTQTQQPKLRLVIGHFGTFEVWGVQTKTRYLTFKGLPYITSRLQTYVDPTTQQPRAVSATATGKLQIWNLQSGDLLDTLALHKKYVTDLVVFTSADGSQVHALTTSTDQTLKLHDLLTGQQVASTRFDAPLTCVSIIQPETLKLIVGDSLGGIRCGQLLAS